MSDIKITIGAEIKELETKLAVAKAKLAELEGVSSKVGTAISSTFKNIGSTLISGGLYAAIGAIVASLVVLGSKLFEVSAQSKRLAQNQKEIAESFKKAADSVGEEISKVTILTSVLESENTSRLQKVEALKELKKINFDYFGQLDLEEGKVKGLTTAYDAYIQRLIRSIGAKANIDLLTGALKEEAEIIATINQNQAKGFEKFKANSLTEIQILNAIRKFGLDFGADKKTNTFLDLDKLQLIADLLNAEDKVNAFRKRVQATIQDAFNPKEIKVKEITVKPQKIKVEPDKDLKVILPERIGNDVNIPLKVNIKADPVIHFNNEKFMADLKAAIEEFQDQMSGIATGAVSNIFQGLADVISGKGGIGDMFKGLAHYLGSNIKQLGQQVLQIAILAKLAKAAIKNPFTGIAAGIALIALGTAIEAATAKNAFASGTSYFGGGTALVGERGPERIFLPQGSSVQPNNEVNAYSGGQTVFIPDVRLNGTDLVIAFNRASAAMGRNN